MTVLVFPIDNAEDFIKYILTGFDADGETVMLAPASGFYATPGTGLNEARIAYVLNEESLNKAMNVIVKGLEAFKNK